MAERTELICVLDASGSMSGLEKDTMGGYQALLDKQKQLPGKVTLTTYFFNHDIKIMHDRADLEEAKKISPKEYEPSGCTALLDAIGAAIMITEQAIAYTKKQYRPDAVIFFITTDGLENASKAFSLKEVRSLIEKGKKKGWEFIFSAANIDAVDAGGKLCVDEGRIFAYEATGKGVRENYDIACKVVKEARMKPRKN